MSEPEKLETIITRRKEGEHTRDDSAKEFLRKRDIEVRDPEKAKRKQSVKVLKLQFVGIYINLLGLLKGNELKVYLYMRVRRRMKRSTIADETEFFKDKSISAKELNISTPTLLKAIVGLEKKGLVKRDGRTSGGFVKLKVFSQPK